MNTLLIPLILFALAMCITPGPNNIMLTASGANFGFKRSIPHILGITGGLATLMILTATGLGILFHQFPQFQIALKIVGSLYLLYLAWKIATIPELGGDNKKGRPLTFFQAALFQFLNPKALVMAFSAMTTFTITGQEYSSSAIRVVLVFLVVCIPSISVWAGFGVAVGKLLCSPRRFKIFNYSMGSLTAMSVAFIIF
jgi:threonine/homoserine/homoserine lactone efflux protein